MSNTPSPTITTTPDPLFDIKKELRLLRIATERLADAAEKIGKCVHKIDDETSELLVRTN